MRTFFASITNNQGGARDVKFEAPDLPTAMLIINAYVAGARLGGKNLEITSLAAYKTRGHEYEAL